MNCHSSFIFTLHLCRATWHLQTLALFSGFSPGLRIIKQHLPLLYAEKWSYAVETISYEIHVSVLCWFVIFKYCFLYQRLVYILYSTFCKTSHVFRSGCWPFYSLLMPHIFIWRKYDMSSVNKDICYKSGCTWWQEIRSEWVG